MVTFSIPPGTPEARENRTRGDHGCSYTNRQAQTVVKAMLDGTTKPFIDEILELLWRNANRTEFQVKMRFGRSEERRMT